VQGAVPELSVINAEYCVDRFLHLLMPLQVRQLAPGHMKRRGGRATSIHVTCAMFSRQGQIVATYNDEASLLPSLQRNGGELRAGPPLMPLAVASHLHMYLGTEVMIAWQLSCR
jgi:hypothetical protein